MIRIRKILCPTDFSEPSYEALRIAGELAREFSAGIVLANVIAPVPLLGSFTHEGPVGFDVPAYQRALAQETQDTLDRLAETRFPQGIFVESRVVVGSATDEIVRLGREEDADLIVIATHGLTGWRRFVFGSVTAQVVRHAPCQVLTIPAPREKEKKGKDHEDT